MRRDQPRSVSAATIRTVLTTAGVAGVLTMTGVAAQAHDISTAPGVTVDTSVLDQLGQPQTVPDLLFPGLHAPRSRLLVPPVDGSQAPMLRKPTSGAAPRSRLRVPPEASPPPVSPMPQRPAREMAPSPRPAPTAPTPPVTEPASAPEASPPETPAPQAPTVEAPAPEAPAPAPAATPSDMAQPASPEEPPATPAASAQTSGDGVTLTFAVGETTLPDAARPQLEDFAKRLSEDESLQVRVMAYAGDTGNDASRARRTSLSRALAVRSFLMDQDVRSTRIEVRALGQPDNGPADRVDLTLLRP